MVRPETKYARSGDVHIAYQVIGDGPIDVVFVQGFISNLEVHWEDPGLTHLFSRLAAFARLIVFDKRGSGVSDRVNDMPDLETRMDDVRADTDRVVDEIEEFLTGVRPVPEPDRVLATVACVEVADRASRVPGARTQWLDRVSRFRQTIQTLRTQYRGREIGRQPDGMALAFDGPVRALRCVIATREVAQQLDMSLHAGIHAGEVEIAGEDIGGSAVHVAARIAAVARADELLVSATVRDLVHGSGLHFANAEGRLPAGDTDVPRLLVLVAATEPAAPSVSVRQRTLAQLSPREREILASLARGLTNAQIGIRAQRAHDQTSRCQYPDQAGPGEPRRRRSVRDRAAVALRVRRERFIRLALHRKSHAALARLGEAAGALGRT